MKNEDRHMEFRDQLVSYLAGEMTSADRAKFEALLASDSELWSLFSEYEKIWDGVDQLSATNKYNMDNEWELFKGRINFDQKSAQVRSIRRYILRIAAAVIIGMVGLGTWYTIKSLSGYDQVALEQGTEQIELADGSRVTLNAGSSIKYSVDRDEGERKVRLTGEAFFEISRDTTRPFIIDAGAASVQVLGTSFNVRAYSETEKVEVTVSSGLVAMSSRKNKDKQIVLRKGNAGILYGDSNKLKLIELADPNAFAWKTREIFFEETPLREVVDVLSQVYHTDIRLADASLQSCPLTVTFSQQEFSAVMNVLTSTLDLQMSRENGSIILSGKGCD